MLKNYSDGETDLEKPCNQYEFQHLHLKGIQKYLLNSQYDQLWGRI